MGVDEGVPCDGVSVRYFVEQTVSVGVESAFRVEVEEGGGDEDVGGEAELEDEGVGLLAGG